MAKDLLLEIGTEEVPAHFMPGILAQLKEKTTAKLQEMRLDFAEITTLGTPRRTALLVKDLAETQQGASSEYGCLFTLFIVPFMHKSFQLLLTTFC